MTQAAYTHGRRYPKPVILSGEKSNEDMPIRSDSIVRAFAEKPGKVFLLYGDKSVFYISLQMAAQAMAGGDPIAVVDGCNRFDVHALSRFARVRKIDPNKFLNQIFISRGFTCYQMEQAIANKLPAFLTRIQSNTALIFGLLDTFYDEQASLREVQHILRRLLVSFGEMRAAGMSLLLVCQDRTVEPKERNQLFTTLKSSADRVYKLGTNQRGMPQLYLETQRGVPRKNPAPQNIQGDSSHGTNRTNLHQPDRRGAVKLVKVPPRTAQRGSGTL
jgi:hypothetical protein